MGKVSAKINSTSRIFQRCFYRAMKSCHRELLKFLSLETRQLYGRQRIKSQDDEFQGERSCCCCAKCRFVEGENLLSTKTRKLNLSFYGFSLEGISWLVQS